MSHLEVRPARKEEREALARSLGRDAYFAERITWQADGRGVLLIAWDGELPVGHVYLWLDEAEEPEIRQHLPNVPLLMSLAVVDRFRGHGIGTRLMLATEDQARGRDRTRIALGVRLDNPRAAALYQKRGYADWGRPPVTCLAKEVLRHGQHWMSPERCRVFVKTL